MSPLDTWRLTTVFLTVELTATFRLSSEPRSTVAMRTLYGVLTNVALIYRRMRGIDTQLQLSGIKEPMRPICEVDTTPNISLKNPN